MNLGTVNLQELYAPVRSELAATTRIFDDELVSEFPFVNEFCAAVRSYRGKMLRPALLLLSGKAAGCLRRQHPTLAAVVEMVHMATLVHDDVLDEADLRRQEPTVAAVSGNVSAVLLGDYLISHAFHLCSGLDSQYACRRVGATTNVVCEGELLQNRHRGDRELTEDVYFSIIRRKTGALTAVACELGAKYAGADDAVVSALHDYGMSAGVAFQIIDDVLDVVGEPTEVGKTLGLDLASGKLTLPTLHALASGNAVAARVIRRALAGSPPTLERLRDLLTETGSVDYAVNLARELVAEAVGKLSLLPSGEARQSLTAMAEFIVQRTS